MHLVRAVLPHCGPGLCEERDVARLIDALWAHAINADGLEHIRGRCGDDCAEMILFLRESAELDPELCAFNLITRAYHSSAAIRATFDPHPSAHLCNDGSRGHAE